MGAALIGSGLLLVYFVIKFIFQRNKVDYSGMVEVTEQDQPLLFGFIRQLTTEAKAPFPKRIFLSADVNAAVFYNSNFWSMFLPVRKNLKIGLGLINALNVSEFKAVMAHEFGHFSQRSMKFGSYVYNMNRVIYNMLYDNDGYGRLLNAMSKLHSLFYLTAKINIWIISGMQFLLRQVYVVLNKTYMRLSRDMEFHADAMAAYVSGSNQVITSLKRIDIAQSCYNDLLNYWSGQLSKDKRADNFYPQHQILMSYYAAKNNLKQDINGLPVIVQTMDVANASQVIIDDQWSSHPSTEDRVDELTRINLITTTVHNSAWSLFNEPAHLQLLLTDDVYSTTSAKPTTTKIDSTTFKEEFYKDIYEFSLDELYAGYYDGRFINQFDVDDAINEKFNPDVLDISELLKETNTSLPVSSERMQQDIYTLQSIVERKDIKTFDYKGNKYKNKMATDIVQEIEKERNEAVNAIETLDRKIFQYAYTIANDAGKVLLVTKYKNLFALQTDSVIDFDLYGNVMEYFNKVYTNMPFEQITTNLANVYHEERKLKPRIKEIMADEKNRQYFTEEQLVAAENYVSANLVYFLEPKYDNNAIDAFNEGTDAYIAAIGKRNFEVKKDLLTFQAGIVKGN
ncbi:MAG: M48 family metalloprotease [Bacteroidota bacterium]